MRWFGLICLALVLSACSEYNLNPEKENVDDPEDTDPLLDTSDTAAPGEEECNGEDDDGDGLVDEGYPDLDADGVADCVDDDCDTDPVGASEVTIVEDCDSPDVTVTDPWNAAIEWQYTVSSGQGVIVMPAVGNLTDDNGDGAIDTSDAPDIAFTTWGSNTLVALNGDGSGTLFTTPGIDGQGGVAIADVDGDGEAEIIGSTPDHRVVAVDRTGAVEWRSSVFSGMSMYPQPTVADLDADGDVEVIVDLAVVEGGSGATVATLSGVSTSWRTPVVADLDVDGTMEIILGEDVFSHTGSLEWSSSSPGWGNFSAVADVDGDPEGEVFFVSGSSASLHDDDGSLLDTWTIPGSNPGPPAVADFDGDGDVEIAIPANNQISVWDFDGTQLWHQPISDSSGLAGCSGYDVNGDGVYEVLYADEQMLRIYDGATGKVHYSNSSHSSGTLWEYPVVADVDNDGSAEIVIASNVYSGTGWKGITVFGHSGDGWVKSGPTWPTHDFSVTNVSPDGSVPTSPTYPWQIYNVFRSRPAVDDAAVDLVVWFADVCWSGCEPQSFAEVQVVVANQGGLDSDAGVPVTLYAVDGPNRVRLDTIELTDPIPAGESLPSFSMELNYSQTGADGLLLVVDDDGAGGQVHSECDESNNEAAWTDTPC